eukprot:1130707-Prymnesium_polylepis.3
MDRCRVAQTRPTSDRGRVASRAPPGSLVQATSGAPESPRWHWPRSVGWAATHLLLASRGRSPTHHIAVWSCFGRRAKSACRLGWQVASISWHCRSAQITGRLATS